MLRRLIVVLGIVAGGCRFETSGVDPGARGALADGAPTAPFGTDASGSGLCDVACSLAGGVCMSGTCVITCGANGCRDGVTCPPYQPCAVSCDGPDACAGGVDCSRASSCDITCIGSSACSAGVTCAGTSCSVTCSGKDACKNGGVTCNAATCAIGCLGDKSCENGTCCEGTGCGDTCSATNGGCCSCGGC